MGQKTRRMAFRSLRCVVGDRGQLGSGAYMTIEGCSLDKKDLMKAHAQCHY